MDPHVVPAFGEKVDPLVAKVNVEKGRPPVEPGRETARHRHAGRPAEYRPVPGPLRRHKRVPVVGRGPGLGLAHLYQHVP